MTTLLTEEGLNVTLKEKTDRFRTWQTGVNFNDDLLGFFQVLFPPFIILSLRNRDLVNLLMGLVHNH